MSKLKVLHIANWYPNKGKIHDGIFIKNHIDGLNQHCDNTVIHIQVKPSNHILKIEKDSNSIIYYTRLSKYYKIQEWLIFWGLFNFLFIKKKSKGASIVNFHIATPLCRYLNFFNFFLRKKIVITEHWTAYYRNFNLPKNFKKLNRIKRIFYKKFHLIAVSEALTKDIKKFSGNEQLNYSVIPNIIDTDKFCYKANQGNDTTFFMITNWSPEKNPFPILHALSKIIGSTNFQLRIAGDGSLLKKMKETVSQLGLAEHVTFIGRIEPDAIAKEFHNATAFLHSAYYETFSVVCAESLCCGCPVIATNIPAIQEYLTEDAGLLVNQFEKELDIETQSTLWINGINQLIENKETFNRHEISEKFSHKFGKNTVGQSYYNVLKGVHNEG